MDWILYGANGYTGELIAREARKRGLTPILAGRSPAVQKLAAELDLPFRIFPLDAKAGEHIRGAGLVLHCAGPFVRTAMPMARACLSTGAHYMDITGEIPVFESLHTLDAEANRAGLLVLPGVGFDVVPTDCLAAQVKNRLPDATRLAIALYGMGRASAGTAASAVLLLADGSRARRGGKLIRVPLLEKSMEFELEGRPVRMHTIPWGDLVTAYISTGIPDIEVYFPVDPGAVRAAQLGGGMLALLKIPPVAAIAQGLVKRLIKGPDAAYRSKHRSYVWAEARNDHGGSAEVAIETLEGYDFTVESALLAVAKVMSGISPPGFQTPSKAFGARFVLEIKGTEISEALQRRKQL